MGDLGIKVANEDKNVLSAAASDLSYSSKYSNLKIYSVETVTLNMPGGTGTPSTTHDNPLPYSPVFKVFVSSSDNSKGYMLVNGRSFESSPNLYFPIVTFDPVANRFTLKASSFFTTPAQTLTFKIVVFVDNFTGTATDLAALGDLGQKVAKQTKTIEDVDAEMSLYSKWRNLTVFEGSTVTSSGGVATVNHNLGYVPIVEVFMRQPLELLRHNAIPEAFEYDLMAPDAGLAMYYVTSTQLNITESPTTDILYRYLIFNERLA